MTLRLSESTRIGPFRLRVSKPLTGRGEHVGECRHQDAVRVLEAVEAGRQDGEAAVSGEGILNGYIAAVMPEIWHSYTCSPCRSALARGGDWAEVNCPSCGRSMQRLAEHALHPSRESLGWTSPPPDCPVTGWPQIDRDDLDMCSCGHRHITIEAIAGGGPK